VPARVIGTAGGTRLRLRVGGRLAIDVAAEGAERIWSSAIDSYFARRVA
jgi:hypothetical protein